MINHLWQSTLFALAAAVAAFALRKNYAQARYWIWVSASMKFLVPFALFAILAIPFHLGEVSFPTPQPVAQAIAKVSDPFPDTLPVAVATTAHQSESIYWWLALIWTCGFSYIAWSKIRGWREVRKSLRASTQLSEPALLVKGVDVRSSASLLEPCVIGWLKPVLILPSGIAEKLAPGELKAVIAHELAHLKRRDNLVSALHMLVETVFWFHPLVWWIGARMLEERERACDESVLRSGAEPADYAEGILKVCKMYVESPFPSAAGVTGADLNKRIQDILTGKVAPDLTKLQKATLAVAAILLLAVPGWVAMTRTSSVRAQSANNQSFEVASIRPCPAGLPEPRVGNQTKGGYKTKDGREPVESPGTLRVCAPLGIFIRMAYQTPGRMVLFDWIQGGPAWVDSDRYMINAKGPSDASGETVRGPMLRALLAQRFHLQAHKENREVAGFALTVARGGIKIPKVPEGSCIPLDLSKPGAELPPIEKVCGPVPGDRRAEGPNVLLHIRGDTMAEFAQFVMGMTGKPIVDRTGLTGRYDIHLKFAPDDTMPGFQVREEPLPDGGVPFFTALQEQLGLKLESAKGTREYFVIDHVERPTEN
jgi:uncharacterized protein (TIGR03435 family)